LFCYFNFTYFYEIIILSQHIFIYYYYINMSNITRCDNLDNLTKYPQNPDITPSLNQGMMFEKYNSKKSNNLEKKNKKKHKEGFGNNKREIPQENVLAIESERIINQNNYSGQSEDFQNVQNQYNDALTQYKNLMDKINGTSNNYLNRVNNNPYLGKTIHFTTGHICYVTQQGVIKYIGNMDIWDSVDPTYSYTDVNIPFLDSYWTYGTYIPELNLIMGTNVELNQTLTNAGENVFVNRLTTNPKKTYKGCYKDKPPATEIMFVPVMNNSNNVSGFQTFASSIYQDNNDYTGPWHAFDRDPNTWWHTNGNKYNGTTGEYEGNTSFGFTDSRTNEQIDLKGEYIGINFPNSYPVTKYNLLGRQGCCGNPTGRTPNSWVIVGRESNGGNTIIDKRDNQAINYEMRTYDVTNSVQCAQYIMFITNCGNPGNQDGNRYCVQIARLDFFTSSDLFLTDSQRAMIRDSSQIDRVDLETCQNYASQNGYKYFGIQDGLDGNTPECLVSNDLAKTQMYGEAFNYKIIPLWDSKTFGNVGNTALLNSFGSIVVNNSVGAAIYSSPVPEGAGGNYLGCYGDKDDRAMPNISNNQYIPLEQCRQLAVDQGLEFYGVQDGHSTDNGWCAGSNDINSVVKYGIATNCTKDSNEKDMGGPWSNAVYSVKGYGNFFLILQDDNNMCIYKGSSPNDNQGAVWCSMTNGQAKSPNSNFAAGKSKFGQNWIPSGTALAANDFIGSNDGSIYLLMQTDGNLVLYTSEASSGCSTNSSGQTLGGNWVNAVYELSPSGFKDNLGKMAYIDENAKLHSYSSDNFKLTTDYTKIEKFDSYNNDIPNALYGNATIDQCKSTCNNLQDCYGFVFDNQNNICYPKTSGMYPIGPTRYLPYVDTYTRGKEPIAVPMGASNKMSQIDSNQYQYYIDGGAMSDKYGLASATEEEQQQLQELQNKLNTLANQINSSTKKFDTGTYNSQNQASKNEKGLNNYIKQRFNIEQQINGILGNNTNNVDTKKESFINNYSVESILKDSDIIVLQKNYEYLFWTILAAASLIIAMNIVKKK